MGIVKDFQSSSMCQASSTQSNMFAVSLQYLQRKVGNGVPLHADKHQTCTSWIIVFDGSSQTCPKYSKYEVRKIFAIY